jgi:TRAP-type C4-dicarboxylate transport system substrate-binding protein
MKKYSVVTIAWLVVCMMVGILIFAPGNAIAKKQVVKFVAVGANEGAPEAGVEAMSMNMYIGALDYRMRTYHALKGKYTFKYISTLFSDPNECLTGVATGAAEMTFSGPHYLEQLEPAWKAVESPGVFESWDHFMRTMNTPAWKKINEKMAKEKGVTILTWMASAGDWYLYTSKGPVNSMADLKGQKIRFAGGEGFSKALKAMGTTPISLPYTEVVTGLQTNMIDGLLTDMFAAFYFYDLPRYTKYCVKQTWAIQPLCIVANTQWWEALPEKERTAMKDVFDRIDTAEYFENAQGAIAQGWAGHPELELLQLSDAESQKWEKVMKEAGASALEGLDPELIKAIEASK